MIPRVLSFSNQLDLIRELKNIKVDDYGIKIMSAKADFFLIKITHVSSIAANILKQEMLSLGAEAAISRQSITGKDKKTACLLMGNFIQLKRLIEKLKLQPFRLDTIGRDLDEAIASYRKDRFLIKCRDYILDTKNKTLIMGIINITPDSFSGDGLLVQASTNGGYNSLKKIILQKAEEMIKDGADIIDIGAESTRPGAKPTEKKEEIKRLSCCIRALVKEFKVPISVDTYKPQVARAVLDLGASIINDITGLRDPQMRKLVSKHNAGAVIMHMKGRPRTMQRNPKYKSLIDEIISFLSESVESAVASGISADSLIIDPGIGFGKTLEHNLVILKNLREFKVLGKPMLLGVSRKSFIGKILKVEPDKRIYGTVAALAMSIKEGANILRVHDVKQIHDVVRVCDAIVSRRICISNKAN